MSLIKEFREFAVKGNVIDLAVGVIIGAAFGKIVTSLVDDIIMPPLGMLLGRVDFAEKFVVMPGQEDKIAKVTKPLASLADYKGAGVSVWAYGQFINVTVQFLLVAFAVFLLVKGINAVRRKEAEKPTEPEGPTPEQKLLTEIRDLLAERKV
ncbi:large conductance mechanosensitive channel protein MscL [bacterium]|nr:MAG: large conductance mechanosensitive channel protein MscL [bacterium]